MIQEGLTMRNHHHPRLAWSAILAALSSFALYAPVVSAQPDYPDEATIRRLADVFYQARYISDPDEYARLAESFYFRNEQERQRFLNGRLQNPVLTMISRRGGFIPNPADTRIAPRPDNLSSYAEAKAVVFVLPNPTMRDSTYWSRLLTFVHVEGSWRLQYDPYLPTPRESRPETRENPDIEDELHIARLEAELDRWTNARGDDLRRIASQKQDDAIYMLAAYQYAREKGFMNVSDQTLERLKQEYAELALMTPAQMKAHVVTDTRARLTMQREQLEKVKTARESAKDHPHKSQ